MGRSLRKYTEITVGARKFKVEWLPRLADRLDTGSNYFDRGLIQVELGEPTVEADILLHEVIHLLISQAALQFASDDAEEDFVMRLTPWFHSFMVQNAPLLRDLLKI